ncbi:MAG: ATP phosphoribosyltransferase regulatory subunit [Gammaproteobacteria bacterium]|nr:ATP phosphoribosyltransferase regulatory subunit [Gammaproteobacteria bacterium]
MEKRIKSDYARWLLPEGIFELLPAQARHLESLSRQLLDLFDRWGYDLVMPPLIEYIESLQVGTGRDLDLQTFKLIDQMTGRLIGIRADMTPQVARIDAHVLKREAPTRLCYLGQVLHTRPNGLSRSRAPLQVGAELYGHSGIESDVEVLRLMVEALRVAGIQHTHIDLGHVGIYRGLVQEAGLTQEQEVAMFEALQRKSRPQIEEYLRDWKIAAKARQHLLSLVDLNGDETVLTEAKKILSGVGEGVGAALDNLCQITALAKRHLHGLPLYFDLAELRGYRYQTGVVFAAFVPGHGQEVARGGRYDAIGRCFGRARPATGFSTDLKTLIQISQVAAAPIKGILAPAVDDAALGQRIDALRAQGERVICALPGQGGTLDEMGCDRRLELRKGRWEVVAI